MKVKWVWRREAC